MSGRSLPSGFRIFTSTLSVCTFCSVNDDWVIDPDSEETCAAPAEPGADAFLHETICALKDAGVWNIVLTPNYNADHRNHFHVDLTSGAHYLGYLEHFTWGFSDEDDAPPRFFGPNLLGD